MATVLSITTTRVRDGKLQEVLALYGRLKKAVERLGARVRVTQQAFGPNPLALSFIVETGGWAEYGAFVEKTEKDAEYQAIIAEVRNNPRSDIVQRAVVTELEV